MVVSDADCSLILPSVDRMPFLSVLSDCGSAIVLETRQVDSEVVTERPCDFGKKKSREMTEDTDTLGSAIRLVPWE